MEPVAADLPSVLLQLRAALQENRRAQKDEAPAEVVELLVALPSLPEDVARLGVPVREGQVDGVKAIELLNSLAEMGWIDSLTAALPWTGNVYRMSPRQRRAALRWLQTNHVAQNSELVSVASAFNLLQGARARLDKSYPSVIQKWLALVRSSSPNQLASPQEVAFNLDEAINSAVAEAHRLELATSSDAAVLLDAAEALVATMGGPVRVSFARAQRVLELHERRSADVQALKNYLQRKDLDNAINALVSQDRYWSLHYLGVGGAGKTMFLRYLDERLSRDLNLCTARVDFDHLNPSYPLRLPGLLLLGFAEELRLKAPEAAIDFFRKLQSTVTEIHHGLEDAHRFGQEVPLGFNALGFNEALTWFVQGLKCIYEAGQRPLLILDTCEELSRITSDHGLPRTVAETFRILEETHKMFEEVRVVFSGRRALASSGHGWRIMNSEMPPRDYLMLCPVGGFSEDECKHFLRDYGMRSKPPRPVPQQFYEDILMLSAETEIEAMAQIERLPTDGAVEILTPMDRVEKRYNPYDVALFANWAASGDATFSREKMSGKRHYYVRERMISRLREDLARWLPSLVVLGRFDEDLVTKLTGDEDVDTKAALWAEVRRQEWVNVDSGTATLPDRVPLPFWNIDSRMRNRLEAYYLEEASDEWRNAIRRVAKILPGWTLEREWEFLSPSYFPLCVSLLEGDPLIAADWWTKVEVRILEDHAWDWADKITAALLSTEVPALHGGEGHPLKAPINALRANVLTRESPEHEELGELWRVVAKTADAYPVPRSRKLLMLRALAGELGQWRYRTELPGNEDLDRIAKSLAEMPRLIHSLLNDLIDGEELVRGQVLYCTWATLENSAEILERLGREHSHNFLEAANVAEVVWGKEIEPYALVCSQRIRFLLFSSPPSELTVAGWDRTPKVSNIAAFDWIRPKDLFARQLLEWGRLFESGSAEHVQQYRDLVIEHAFVNPTNLDQDRLLSQAMRIGGLGSRTIDDWRTLIASSLALGTTQEECQAHRVVPPLYASLIQWLADEGYPDAAIVALNEARAGQTSKPILRWLNALSAYINRRFRLAEPEANAFEVPEMPAQLRGDVTVFVQAAASALTEVKTRKLPEHASERLRSAALRVTARLAIELPTAVADLTRLPPCWQPWFARYLLIIQESAAQTNQGERESVRKALAALYPTGQTPQDIGFAFESRKSRDWLYLLILVLIGIALFIALIWGGILVAGKAAKRIIGNDVAWYWDVAILVAFGIAFASARAILRVYAVFLGRAFRVRYEVRPSGIPERPYEVATETRLIFLPTAKRPNFRKVPEVSTSESYAQGATLFGLKLKPNAFWRMKSILDSLLPFDLRTSIVIDGPELSGVCWEALIGMGRSRPSSVKSPLVFRRTQVNSQRLIYDFPQKIGLAMVTASKPLRFEAKAVTGSVYPTSTLPNVRMWNVGILIFQTEVSTPNGVVRFTNGRGSYAAVDDIARQFPELRLCVLVDLERGEIKARTPLDRISAARMRRAAHELFVRGVPAVITIPYLPARNNLLNRVLGILAAASSASPNACDDLQIGVRDIRELIFKQCGLRPTDAAELAYDVCYYAADVVNLRSGPDVEDPTAPGVTRRRSGLRPLSKAASA